MSPIMYGCTMYVFEIIRIFKLLTQSIGENSRTELQGCIAHKLYLKSHYSINVVEISLQDSLEMSAVPK